MKKKLLMFLIIVAGLYIMLPVNIAVASASTDGKVLSEIRYAQPIVYQSKATESFSFVKYEELEYNTTPNNCPKYYYSGYSNACGAVIGADIIGYYDKYYEDLIPNYVTYYSSGRYRSTDTVYIPALIDDLYTLMRTNVDDVGVSYNDFISGLSQYVSSKNHNISYTSAFSNGKINYSAVKSAVDQGKVLVLFCEPTEVYELNITATNQTITTTNISSSHIMLVYGYRSLRYTFSDGSTKTDTYILVSTGLDAPSMACYNINSDDVIQVQRVDIT